MALQLVFEIIMVACIGFVRLSCFRQVFLLIICFVHYESFRSHQGGEFSSFGATDQQARLMIDETWSQC